LASWTNAPTSNYFGGNIDEARVSGVAASSSWILTEYNNQSSPSTFYIIGAQNQQSAGTLSCVVTSTCTYPSIGVLYLASTTNSHASLSSSSAFTKIVCCSGVGSLSNNCASIGPAVPFVHLSAQTNSHAEVNTQNVYPQANYACLSTGLGGAVSVGYVTSTSCTAAGYDTTLISIASTTNAHVAAPGSSTFQSGSTIQVCASAAPSPPSISNVQFNGGSAITLTPNATTSISLSYTVSDYSINGCSDVFTSGHVTSTAFLDIASSTCENNPTANNLNCYVASFAGGVNSCGGSSSTSATATDTLNIYYLARSSGVASSSYPSSHWYGYVSIKTQSGVTSTAQSGPVDMLALSALNTSTSSINFGPVLPNTNTGSTNKTIVVSNVGNVSTTPQLSGTVFVKGSNSFATSSEHYATSSFTFGGSERQMSDSPTTITGLVLPAPAIVNSNPSSTIYFGLQVPFAVPSGTYTSTTTFTGMFAGS
jgi:hypothetical protein